MLSIAIVSYRLECSFKYINIAEIIYKPLIPEIYKAMV